MKHTETRNVPARVETVVVKVTCDICGAEIKRYQFDAESVTVEHKTGSSYPEGGSGQTVSVDMCGACFDMKLVPWLRSNGAEPRIDEWDY